MAIFAMSGSADDSRFDRQFGMKVEVQKDQAIADVIFKAWESGNLFDSKDGDLYKNQAMRLARSIVLCASDAPFEKGFVVVSAMQRMNLNAEMRTACITVLQNHFGNKIDFTEERNPFSRIADDTRRRSQPYIM